MPKEINNLNDNRVQDMLRESMIKQMELGYQEMGALNLEISNEMYHLESESEVIQENIWKSNW